MNHNYILIALTISLIAACDTTEDPLPEAANAIIGGETFTPTEKDAKKSGDGFIISFEEGTKKIEIVTNDTIAGTYSIISQSLKSAKELQANITYTDGSVTYSGTKGAVEITKDEAGTISGTYDATVTGNDMAIEISSGSFENIQLENSSLLLDTEAAIIDALQLSYTSLFEYIENLYLFDAVYSNHIPAPDDSWTDIYNHTQSSDNEKVLELWSDAYDIIYETNLIEMSSGIVTSAEYRDMIIAQAKAIRSYLYYNLLIWFGEIPIETGTSEGMNPRNTVPEVVAQIVQDATDASLFLPWLLPSNGEFRIPRGFATGLMARVHLYSKDYDNALNRTEEIINSGNYLLDIDPDNFSATNPEIIVGFEKGNNTAFNNFFTKGSYVPVIRYTEMILVSAESHYFSGNTEYATVYINEMNARRSEPIVTSLSADDIFQQWNTELVKEGSMFITLKRFDKAVSVVQDPHKLLLPVPFDYLSNNFNSTQNPGY